MRVTEKWLLCFSLQEIGWFLQLPPHPGQSSTDPAAADQEKGPKGDPEMVPIYVDTLLPMFCQTFQSSMVASVKRASLGLIKKMLHYLEADMMENISKKEVAGDIVEVL